MRRVHRRPLTAKTAQDLRRRQAKANGKRETGTLDVTAEWEKARKTKPLKTVLAVLESMAGERARCMYCHDSHATDIEHFWPKSGHPGRMFAWTNLLLCRVECGRLKGGQFPLDGRRPLLINPASGDPWRHLDFDPETGNITARYRQTSEGFSERGTRTVEVPHLDRREALATGYRKTFKRLTRVVNVALEDADALDALPEALLEADDHGLLGWCLTANGQNVSPFAGLRRSHPDTWAACLMALERR